MRSASPVVIVVTVAIQPLVCRSPINDYIRRQQGRVRVGTPQHLRLSTDKLAHPLATAMALICSSSVHAFVL